MKKKKTKKRRKYVYVGLCHWFSEGNNEVLEHHVQVFRTKPKAQDFIASCYGPGRIVKSSDIHHLAIN